MGLSFITVAPLVSQSRRCPPSRPPFHALFLMADDVIADLQNEFMIRIELIKLRTSRSFALEYPEISFESSATEGTPPAPEGSAYG